VDRRLEPRERPLNQQKLWYGRAVRSPTGRRVFAWAMLGSALAWGQVAATGSAQLSLRWSDPGGIAPITQSELETRLTERLGRPAFDGDATAQALSVTWQGTAEQCQVELQLLRGNEVEGTRHIESPSGDCRSLAPALLTVAALLIEAHAEPEPEPPLEIPPPAPATEPPEADAPAPADAPALRTEPPLLISLGGEVSALHSPRAAIGPAAELMWTPLSRFRLGLRSAWFLQQEYGASPGLKLAHQTAALLGCGMPLTGALNLGLCASTALHRWATVGTGLPHPEVARTYSWTLGLGARAEWRLSRRLWWVADAGVEAAPAPLYFYFVPPTGGEAVVFRQNRFAPLLFVGLTLELP
jgi:hypothetical protein